MIAVHNADLVIDDQEFVVLVGPSGCGKSTSLRMVAGLEEPTTGNIYIGDRLVNDVPPKDRDIAMVFQNYSLYPHMDVYNNMAFGLKLRQVPEGGNRSPGAGGRRRFSASRICCTASRGSSPAVSASGWPWAGPSCGSRRRF